MDANDPNANMSNNAFPSSLNYQDGSYGDMNFDGSEFFEFDEWIDEDSEPLNPGYPQNIQSYAQTEVVHSFGESSYHEGPSSSRETRGTKEIEQEEKERFVFRTMTQIEILEDGFKWRKYGKKMVKNNPNPRNYFRCSVESCPVKKRVERDKEDSRYVITTYEGIHNHLGPSQL